MPKKPKNPSPTPAAPAGRPSALVDTRVIYCGDNLDQLAKLPDRCVELHRVLKTTGSFYYHCDWHASHYVKIMLDQILLDKSGIVYSTTTRRVCCSAGKYGCPCGDAKPSASHSN